MGWRNSRSPTQPSSMLIQTNPAHVSQGISTRFRLPQGLPWGKSSSQYTHFRMPTSSKRQPWYAHWNWPPASDPRSVLTRRFPRCWHTL